MSWQLKLVLMNLAAVAALYYRWHHGAPTSSLLIAGGILFPLINVLILLTRKTPASR